MILILILVLLPVYIISTWQLFTKRKILAFYVLFLYYFVLDYLNYIVGLDAGIWGYVVKIYPDIIFICLLFYYFHKGWVIDRNKKHLLFVLFILSLCCSFIYLGLTAGSTLSGAILDMRTSVFPVLMAYMLVHSDILKIDDFFRILRFCGILVLCNALIAIYQYITYNGIPESSWRFDFLQLLNLRNDPNYEERMVVYQIERDGNLRASGLFLSALSFSFLEAFYCVYYIFSLLSKKINFFNILKVGISVSILLLGIYCSQVRTSLIIVFFSFLFLCFVRKNKTGYLSFKPKLSIGLSFLLCLFTFFSINVLGEGSVDASSYGRIIQYKILFDEFRFSGYGLGAYKGLFDSFYIYGLMTFGVLFFVFIFYMIFIYFRSYAKILYYVDGFYLRYKFILLLSFVSFPVLLYVMSVQHTSGSIYYMLNFYQLFLIESISRNYKNNHRPLC